MQVVVFVDEGEEFKNGNLNMWIQGKDIEDIVKENIYKHGSLLDSAGVRSIYLKGRNGQMPQVVVPKKLFDLVTFDL